MAKKNIDTLMMSIPEAEWFTKHYKNFYSGFNKYTDKKSLGGPIKKDKYYTISNSRVNSARNALIKAGYDRDTANNLSKILAAHSISETGWLDPKDNNYAGHLDSTRKRIVYPTPEAFWDYHISNLSNRFPGWDKATNMKEYDEAINHSSLGLDTEAKFKAYQKAHPDTYIYAPMWENKNYLGNMESIYNKRVVPNIVDPVVEQPSGFSARALIDASRLPDDQKAILLKDYGDMFSSGGGIHIKPSHRGKLTALKKRTGKSEAELYASGSPAVRKMITFARNARKWNHADGGFINRFSQTFDGNTAEMLAAVRKAMAKQ